MTKEEINRAIKRISHEILEKNHGTKDLAIIGIWTRGVHLAQRILNEIKTIENVSLPSGILDITFYRDDVDSISRQPVAKETHIPFDVRNKKIVLVDDVLFTGRSIRAALDEIIDLGRPKNIQLAVLIDRGHRELPITADYVGKFVQTSLKEEVIVRLRERDKKDEVVLMCI